VIALDTNVLVYAERNDSIHHDRARELVKGLAQGTDSWAIPWPCVYEYLRVVTHPKLFRPPTALEVALDNLESLFESPSLELLGEGNSHRGVMARVVREGRAIGNLAYDAHIAALVLEHGVQELWTSDRDFARFPGVRVRNPFTVGVQEPRSRYAPRRAARR
jgi:toxin-antitoxin system PIN domain toxin